MTVPNEEPSAPDRNERSRRVARRLGTDVPYTSPFTVVGRIRSLRHAAKGMGFVLRSQHNAWLHAVATVLALVLAVVLHVMVKPLTAGEWADFVLAVALVWVAETFNTGLEVLAGPSEATAAGNIGLQAVATGVLEDTTNLRDLVRESLPIRRYVPHNADAWNRSALALGLLQ